MSPRFLLAASCLLLAGCEASNLAPVSGRVTLDGRPLANVVVAFQPVRIDSTEPDAPGPGSTGKTDKDGRFSLRLVASERLGAFPGAHKVYIGASGRAANDVAPVALQSLPAEFTSGALQFVVPAQGTTTANFDLKSGGN